MSRLAHAIISRVSGRRSASGDRATVDGYAQVEIIDQDGDVVHVRVVTCDCHRAGTPLRLPRRDVYATRDEHAHFGRLVAWFCDGSTPPGERPPAPSLAAPAEPTAPAATAYDGQQALLAF